jgi:acyl-CoA thioesterase II
MSDTPVTTDSPGAVSSLVAMLDLERVDRDIFRGPNPGDGGRRLFGGQVASQALRAAASTVEPEHHVNSLHAYFLRPGVYGTPVVYTVDRIRDGRSFSTRRVVALQDGEAILNLDASFHAEEEGGEFQLTSPLDDVPGPESLTRDVNRRGPHQRPVDSRSIELPGDPDESRTRWVKTLGELPDDPILHACAITYMSDSGPVGVARRAIGGPEDGGWRATMMTASLDHCLWFHRRVRADEWLFYRLEAVVCGRGRGLSRGQMWTPAGDVAVTVTQEALLRWRRSGSTQHA